MQRSSLVTIRMMLAAGFHTVLSADAAGQGAEARLSALMARGPMEVRLQLVSEELELQRSSHILKVQAGQATNLQVMVV